MPPMDRKYVKQNLARSHGHIDSIQQYWNAIGQAFVEQALKISDDMEQWPIEYKTVMQAADTAVQLCQVLRELTTTTEETI